MKKLIERQAAACVWLLNHPRWSLFHRPRNLWTLENIEKDMKAEKRKQKLTPTVADAILEPKSKDDVPTTDI